MTAHADVRNQPATALPVTMQAAAAWTAREDAMVLRHLPLFARQIAALLQAAGFARSEHAVRARRLRLAWPDCGTAATLKGNAAQAEARSWPAGLCDPFAERAADRNLHKDAEHVRNLLSAWAAEQRARA